MRNKIFIALLIAIGLLTDAISQNTVYYGDSIEIITKDYISGSIQWQISTENENWNDLINENEHKLKLFITNDIYLRIKHTDGDCIIYSEASHIKIDNTKKVYGVKIDRKNVKENNIERIYNSVSKNTYSEIEGIGNLKTDDFDSIYPYSNIKLCNIHKTSNNETIIIYEDDIYFNRNNDTFVEIPLFFMKRYIEGNFEYRLISETQYPDFYPAPMFIERDKIINKVYIGVYETSIDEEGNAKSVTGKLPATELTLNKFREVYEKKGVGFSSIDIRTVMSLQHLYLIRNANKNSQESIGGGWSDLRQPIIKIQNNGPSNMIIINETAPHTEKFWFKNQSVCTLKEDYWTVAEYANIVDIIPNTPSSGQTTFILDKTLTFNTSMFFGSSAQLTGYSDVINHDTGRTKNYTKDLSNQACAVKLFGIENLWGNVWEFIDGFYMKDLKPYISYNSSSNSNFQSYYQLDYLNVEQKETIPWNGIFGFIGNFGIDINNTWYAMPNEFGEKGVSGKSGYGDFYYQYKDPANVLFSVFGGGFDHFDRAGIFNIRNSIYLTNTWYLYGSRMQFKFID